MNVRAPPQIPLSKSQLPCRRSHHYCSRNCLLCISPSRCRIDYLAAVAEGTEQSARTLGEISADTGQITQSTQSLAAEIPVWLRFGEVDQSDLRQRAFQHSANNFSFKIENSVNTVFEGVSVVVKEPGIGRIYELIEDIVIPPGEALKLNVDITGATTDLNLICISAVNRARDRRQTEIREVRREGRGATLLLRTTRWEFEDGQLPDQCR